ncbi:MAG: hypothetical protein ACXADY_26970 [Candidatus Hodarchaeales archaeon]|jgi:hypothetical protein
MTERALGPEEIKGELNGTAVFWLCGNPVLFFGDGGTDGLARRIVACVNACQGVPTDALEAVGEGMMLTVQDDPLAELHELEGEPDDDDGPQGGGSIRA